MNGVCGISRRILILLLLAAGVVHAAPPDAVVCGKCHPRETAAYARSAMGNSIGVAAALASTKIVHQRSGAEIQIKDVSGRMVHALTSNGLTAEYPIAYQVGAGKIGHTYMVKVGDYFFESPASWYAKHGWDVSPGYQLMQTVDFDRPVESACIFCHADSAKFSGSDGRRFAGDTLSAIGCDRCHGDGEAHAARPSPNNIINPSKLTRRARDSVCEQCHLEGDSRLLNPGKTWRDFHAGDEFERTAVTYLLTKGEHQVRAVGQVEQLSQSKCVRASGGKMWCGTCHDPHGEAPDRQKEIRGICVGCHATLSKAAHPAVTECVSCHMARLTPDDIPHAASTDHRILRRPAAIGGDAGKTNIEPWQEPPAEVRAEDYAVAAMVIGGQHRLPALRDEGVALLEKLPQDVKDRDAAVLSSLISVRLQQRQIGQARELARRATELQPDSGFASLNLALALENSGDEGAAERQYLRTIDLDPSLQAAWTNLLFLYERRGRTADKAALIERYLKWNPQSIWFRQLKAMTAAPR